jgi:hypothetical protein
MASQVLTHAEHDAMGIGRSMSHMQCYEVMLLRLFYTV